jgi:hypothetical protein
LSKGQDDPERPLRIGERVPDTSEALAIGALSERIARGAPSFNRLVRCDDARLVFKDEEGTGADRMMTPRLREHLHRLASLVARRWPGVPDLRVRVTEAWDERREHGPNGFFTRTPRTCTFPYSAD